MVHREALITYSSAVRQKPGKAAGPRTLAIVSHGVSVYFLAYAGRSGLVVSRLPAAREGPGSNRAADKRLCFHENHCDTQLWARLHTDCSAWVDSAFHPPRDGKWVSTLCMSDNTWWWVNVLPITAYKWIQRSSLQLGLRVGSHLKLTDFGPEEPRWTLA